PDKPVSAMLIIRNDAGYLRLSELLTAAYDGKDRNIHHAELNPEWLENGDSSGLICLSGAQYGEVGVNLLNGNEDAAGAAALKYA
ncbi:PHP domain-containing protein, partial [Neisseria meningitidis]|uniref:PHP domain-containing protein n=1 Tax=Neisseria meningitidis TaxID=487 RepID=UPI000CA7BBF6